ncbi:phosphoribosylanthranilate isomerase [Dysgonomonas sp. PFB1-18]|uniref:phosphoribosylanthranilate isomerase n=1 Tax=unclassified Dysgonomonas TaxID=2630389 RepID=UPI0024770282|nr:MULTISPECIES: phosphoribosylanthranilate isomerase [unclassified Dysgonomonas]MDL2302934.1 phosphoribosylanthranilate isomerase [Dysgonomonas sp. OttesenSCG-928-D17]MDH6309816.1 phosphoribosylanthranilate isomerase [Dysgonomonas sp. PF1-14]MDH6339360.1 phosphoribosylanthranilate isomerase [Dysgonomonas sp. PF1-16]MDH6380859.1 phosphoribosylanthranilate isomerase [Dysgonomonas sp. PFB1-18]MDH6397868.1 phosphoribosylanthranilate isomerase [Dysgonomonas sp. PF1-23]
MNIKVCGMKYPDNIKELGKLPIHFMGMIFYPKSPRFVGSLTLSDLNSALPPYIERVGVFVNESIEYIIEKTNLYNLNLIQLHGNESVEFCEELSKAMPIIKAFNVSKPADFEQTKSYEDSCSYFLFDTKTPQYGGSGQKFDWEILSEYRGNTSFFLSGGISVEDADSIKQINHPKFYGIDLNSKFEIAPGLKDIEQLQQFIKALRDEQD